MMCYSVGPYLLGQGRVICFRSSLRSGTPGAACRLCSDGRFYNRLTVNNRIVMLCWPGWMGAGSRQGHTTAASLISKGSQPFFRISRLFSEEYEPRGILRAMPGAVRPMRTSWALITFISKPSPRNRLNMCFCDPCDSTRFCLIFRLKQPSAIEII